MALAVGLIMIAIALVFTLAVPELLGLFNDAEAEPTGIPSSIQDNIGSYREIIGVVVILVIGALFAVTFNLFRNER